MVNDTKEKPVISKVRLLSEADQNVPHNFWETSPTRKAQAFVIELIKDDPLMKDSLWAFIGEKDDGLWIWFFDNPEAAERLTTLL